MEKDQLLNVPIRYSTKISVSLSSIASNICSNLYLLFIN